MTPERHREVEQLFLRALEVPPEQRAVFLEDACRGDQDLRHDVEALLTEDEDMFASLLAIEARGFYRPDLVIHHYVPPERLTKRYFRRWCFWRGVSRAVLDSRRRAPVSYLLGVPRYMVGLAVRGTIETARSLGRGAEPARTFANELAWWDLAGFVYGKYGSYVQRCVARVTGRGEPRGSTASNHAS